MRPFLPALLLLATAASTSPAMNLRMEAAAAWSENIGRSTAPSDWRDARKFDLLASASTLREWHTGFFTVGALDVGFSHVPRFDQLDTFTAGGAIEARRKFGLGAYAPVVSLDTGLHARGARRDGDDGWTASGAVRFAQRLTPAWRVTATGDWQQHYARDPLFDTKHHRVFATLTWSLTDRWSLSHGNGRLWGSFTANASRSVWARALAGGLGRDIADYYHSIHWATTESLGPGWVTYLVDGHVSFWWLELSPALGRDTSLPLRYERLVSLNRVGIRYQQDVWTLQLLHRF